MSRLWLAMLIPAIAVAGPMEFQWQGRLLDAAGEPLQESQSVTVSLYRDGTSGAAHWTDTFTVTPSDGYASLRLGSGAEMSLSDIAGDTWMEVTSNGEVLSPRMLWASVPHAAIASAIPLDGPTTTLDCSGQDGAIVFDTSLRTLRVCDGTNWTPLVTGDGTPDPFAFTDDVNVEPGEVAVSNTVTLADFDFPLPATVTGEGNPFIEVNGVAAGASATVEAGDTLAVGLTASSDLLTPHTATVTVGSVSADYTATTRPECAPGSFVQNAHGDYTLEIDGSRSQCVFSFVLDGAGGGPSRFGAGPGGPGGRVSFDWTPPSQGTLTITVGEPGVATNGQARHGGGGAAGDRAGSGGGATYVYFDSVLLGVAGGGGGGGGNYGGSGGMGGGTTGGDGQSCSGGAGGGGTQSAGGSGGSGASNNGSFLQGGNGTGGCCGGGGGGGGGYFGGGSGGGNPTSNFSGYCGGTGGGGSSFVASGNGVTNGQNTAGAGGAAGVGAGTGNGGEVGGPGVATISWTIP